MANAPTPVPAASHGGRPRGHGRSLASPPPRRLRLVAGLVRAAALVYLSTVGWALTMTTVPMLTVGWRAVVITTGSMQPVLRPGDLVLYDPDGADRAHAGQIAVFADPLDPARLITHRLITQVEGGAWRTKGDANPVPDPAPLPPGLIRGTGRLVIPYLGLPHLWHLEGRMEPLALATAGTLLAIAIVLSGRPFGGSATRPALMRRPARP
jgi:signal peptidase